MAIAMTIDFGEHKGHGYVDDSCVVKTQAEVDQIITNCYRLYVQSELQKYQQSKILQKETTNEPNKKI